MRRSRKPKIKLNTNKVAILTGIIALVCIALLVISVGINSPKTTGKKVEQSESSVAERTQTPQTTQPPQTTQIPQTQPESQSQVVPETLPPVENQGKTAEAEPESPKSSPSDLKKIPEKTVASTPASEKSVKAPSKPATSQKQVTSEKMPTPSKSVKAPETKSSKQQQGPTAPIVPYAIPEAVKGATLVFIFDDAGQSVSKVQRYTSLPFPLTIAVLPQIAHSKDCADVIRKAGKEVMLHQPMQAENLKISPGPGAITPTMSTYEIAATLKKNLDEVGPVAGLNNHEGSLITEDEIKIGTVLDVAAERNIYFVDSRTTAATKAPQAALERDMHIFERDVFLDDVVNKDKILDQIYRALSIANKKGKVIIIGHVDKSADIIPSLLRDMYPYLAEKGYKFAVPSKVK